MKNLTIKTFFTFLLLSFLIMGTVYFSLIMLTPYSYNGKNADYIRNEAEELSGKCMGKKKEDAEKLIYKMAVSTGVDAELMDGASYRELETAGGGSALEGVLTYPLRFSDREDEYVLCVTQLSARTKAFQNSIKRSIPIALVIALILSFIGSKVFSYYLKRPIVRMSKIAQKMAGQDFGWYCPDEREDEIGVLAKSLNKLSDELSGALHKLNDKNLYLKNEIELEKERERRRMLFFSGVSHELKTPISIVIGQIDGMRNGVGVYKDRDKYLDKCSATLKELVDFINEILLVAHIDMGDMDERKAVELDAVLDEQIAFYDGMLSEKSIELAYEVPDHIEFYGDKRLLEKAVGNIIGNAVRYTPEHGKVRIELKKDQETSKVTLTVFNSPSHIDEIHLPHLFEAFYRADQSGGDGSGLGLYITGMVMEMFDAEYRISNADDGVMFVVEQ